MDTATTLAALRRQVGQWRQAGGRIALVPTMGNLHAGHLRLVAEARQHAAHVVASVFVNPMQFSDAGGGDFERYPRSLAADREKLQAAQADLLFAPAVEEIYPAGFTAVTRIEVPGISDILCGAYRPGHFAGVATIVAKLFNLVQPDVALFGEKDFQQLLVIRRMAAELCFPVQIVGVPTVREPSGLAMSSRNQYLSDAERRQAAQLYATLQAAAARLQEGEQDIAQLEMTAMARLTQAGFRPEYFSVRRAADLQPAGGADTELVILAAAWLGGARLIDNVPLQRARAPGAG